MGLIRDSSGRVWDWRSQIALQEQGFPGLISEASFYRWGSNPLAPTNFLHQIATRRLQTIAVQ
jgi:hypothetical protein